MDKDICEITNCNRQATELLAEAGDAYVCKGHSLVMYFNLATHTVDMGNDEQVQQALDLRRKAREWFKDNPNTVKVDCAGDHKVEHGVCSVCGEDFRHETREVDWFEGTSW